MPNSDFNESVTTKGGIIGFSVSTKSLGEVDKDKEKDKCLATRNWKPTNSRLGSRRASLCGNSVSLTRDRRGSASSCPWRGRNPVHTSTWDPTKTSKCKIT